MEHPKLTAKDKSIILSLFIAVLAIGGCGTTANRFDTAGDRLTLPDFNVKTEFIDIEGDGVNDIKMTLFKAKSDGRPVLLEKINYKTGAVRRHYLVDGCKIAVTEIYNLNTPEKSILIIRGLNGKSKNEEVFYRDNEHDSVYPCNESDRRKIIESNAILELKKEDFRFP